MPQTGTFHCPPRCQGQIVAVSYGATDDGFVIRHSLDRSDRTESYQIARQLVSDQGDYWQAEPRNKRWRTMTPAEVKRYGLS
jgi:hypothetical protein